MINNITIIRCLMLHRYLEKIKKNINIIVLAQLISLSIIIVDPVEVIKLLRVNLSLHGNDVYKYSFI
jgi:hypothetical protein